MIIYVYCISNHKNVCQLDFLSDGIIVTICFMLNRPTAEAKPAGTADADVRVRGASQFFFPTK